MARIHKHIITLLFIPFVFIYCEEPIDPKSINFDDLIVIEGMVTDQLENQTIKISRTYPLNQAGPRPVSGADVRVIVDNGEAFSFIEKSPGIYKSMEPFQSEAGKKYQLLISTSNGNEYASDVLAMTLTPEIANLYADFTPVSNGIRGAGDFSFFFNIKENNTETRFFRWQWVETYKIKVPNPSRWKWLGGDDFVFRDESKPEEQEEYCFRADTSKNIIVGSSELQTGEIIDFPIHTFDALSRRINIRYSLEVIQYGLSPQANEYWQAIAASSQDQGSLFDEQPGTIVGNIKSLTNPDEIVLGIFEVTQKKTIRAYFRPSDFYSQGFSYSSTNWLDCNYEPVVIPFEEAGAFMQENHSIYELLFYGTGVGAVFGYKRCALCTLYGTNTEPEFWEEG